MVDHRGDIYALGVILYELVTGRLPFEGPSSAEILVQHVTAAAPHLPADVRATKLGAMLDAIIQRCMEKDPAARFPSAAPLARMFDDLGRGGEVAFTGIGGYLARRPSARARQRRELARAVGGITVGMVLALVLGGEIMHLHAQARAREAANARAARIAAAAATPAPAPAPAQVTLTFESDPPGAEVFAGVGQSRQRLGTTPFERAFRRRAEVVTFEFVLPDHEPMHVPTPLTSDRTISATLTHEAAAERSSGR
jgi:serine/threonine-protein kinase